MKAIPGKKTDVKDSEWICDLLAHGLLKPSFIPPPAQRQLRDLTRYRSQLVADRTQLINRLHKVLEDANLKLSAVASDVTGVSGRAILGRLLEGESDVSVLAGLARGKLMQKRTELERALTSRVAEHHRFLLIKQLAQLDFLDEQIEEFSAEIASRLGLEEPPSADNNTRPPELVDNEVNPQLAQASLSYQQQNEIDLELGSTDGLAQKQVEGDDTKAKPTPLSNNKAIALLDTIPGINQRIAEVLIAEIGLDMSRFPSAAHLASWAKLCPGNYESAGKRKSGRTGQGSRWLKQIMVEAAHGAMRTKETFVATQGRRFVVRLGKKKALIAMAHSLLVIVYHVLRKGTPYKELGSAYYDQRDSEAAKRRAVRKLEGLGYAVTLQAIEQAA
jgi:transposase